ncbi:MAG: ABC transporter permease [Candidatus Sumerlaeia bacterium]
MSEQQNSPGIRHKEVKRLTQLSLPQIVAMSWRNISVRLGRSLLVTSGIILALAFLSYIMCSDTLLRSIVQEASPKVLEQMREEGILRTLNDENARIQTRWMVGLALLVSFVGILNAMLLSVTERYAEIGTMKCLGALDGLIVKMFLIESLFQGLVGTSAGILIGMGLAFLELTFKYGGAVWTSAPWLGMLKLVSIALGAGLILTILGALYPGWRAAKMKPIEAMRAQV